VDLERLVAAPEGVDIDVGRPGHELKDALPAFEDRRRAGQAGARQRGGEDEDAGISGAKGRELRPGLDSLMKAVARREIDMVAAWSVDRLGRSLTGLLELLTELHAKKVDLYLHQQGLDTSTPSGRAMFQMMGVFAEFERAMIRERVLAGLARAKQDGIHLGRKFTEDTKDGNRKIKAALAMRAKGVGIRKIAREVGLGVGTVLRLTATS